MSIGNFFEKVNLLKTDVWIQTKVLPDFFYKKLLISGLRETNKRCILKAKILKLQSFFSEFYINDRT